MNEQPALDLRRGRTGGSPERTGGSPVLPAAVNRAEQIRAAFESFHAAHPLVWTWFEKFALEAVAAGHRHYCAAGIFERIRWHAAVETSGGAVKLNNNFRAYYARLFHAAHPEHAGFFRNRVLTSRTQPAGQPDRQEFVGQAEV